MGDARLCALGDEVEDGGAGGLATRAGGGGDGDEGLEGLVDRAAFSEGRVDKVEEVGFRVGVVQVHELGCIYDGAAADGEEGVWLVRPDPVYRFLDSLMGVSDGGKVK